MNAPGAARMRDIKLFEKYLQEFCVIICKLIRICSYQLSQPDKYCTMFDRTYKTGQAIILLDLSGRYFGSHNIKRDDAYISCIPYLYLYPRHRNFISQHFENRDFYSLFVSLFPNWRHDHPWFWRIREQSSLLQITDKTHITSQILEIKLL